MGLIFRLKKSSPFYTEPFLAEDAIPIFELENAPSPKRRRLLGIPPMPFNPRAKIFCAALRSLVALYPH
jgi:hypothetical protein